MKKVEHSTFFHVTLPSPSPFPNSFLLLDLALGGDFLPLSALFVTQFLPLCRDCGDNRLPSHLDPFLKVRLELKARGGPDLVTKP